jgi:acetyl esterase
MKPRIDPDIERILPLLPLGEVSGLTPEQARQQLVALAQSRKDAPLPEVASVTDTTVDGAAGAIPARIYATATRPAPTVVFFHGGGWVAGDLFTHDRQARNLARDLDAVVVSVDYRRPPETPFPGAYEDCLAATRWAAATIAKLGGDPSRLAVAGDSAGGNLAAAVAQGCRSAGGPRLKAQFLVYPALDLAGGYGAAAENARFPSRQENATGYFLTDDAMRFFAGHYLGASKGEDPRASPLRTADLGGLPPAVICTAELDPLRDEGEAYADRLKQAGVEVAYFREPGLIHGYFGMGAASPAAEAARRRATAAFGAML